VKKRVISVILDNDCTKSTLDSLQHLKKHPKPNDNFGRVWFQITEIE